jgi:glycosyltransferase involved in cell wall biosynthesis
VLTLFGYVTANKGYAMVAEMLHALPRDVMFVIAGGARLPAEEQYVQHLKRHIASLGVSKQVIVTGYLSDEDLAEAMAATDVALVPHTQATSSYSVAFPLSYGKPTLASDLPYFRELLALGDCLELFKTADKNDFRDKLLALLDSPPRRHELAAKALSYAGRQTWPHIATATRDIYQAAIDSYHRNGHPTVPGAAAP